LRGYALPINTARFLIGFQVTGSPFRSLDLDQGGKISLVPVKTVYDGNEFFRAGKAAFLPVKQLSGECRVFTTIKMSFSPVKPSYR
jgi:hypothetical protein